ENIEYNMECGAKSSSSDIEGSIDDFHTRIEGNNKETRDGGQNGEMIEAVWTKTNNTQISG
ncbi:hypothetical protein PV327_011700, partial [Microctonus hyperodae]